MVLRRPEEIRAFKDMTQPQDVNGIKRFPGMSNYSSRFTPNLAEIMKSLTEMTQGNEMCSWSSQHGKDFLKALPSSQMFLSDFPKRIRPFLKQSI